MTDKACYVCKLPPNCTSVLQPLNVGVMGPFKAKLRALWLAETDVHITAADKRRAKLLRAIKAWNEITPDVIRKSFIKVLRK